MERNPRSDPTSSQMRASETEAGFLAHVVSYDDTAESRRLMAGITQAHQDECCVQHAMRLPVLLVLLAAVGLCYWKIFLAEREFVADDASTITWSARHLIANGFWGLGLGSLICLLVLLGLLVVYHRRTGRWRQEGRRFGAKLLEARMTRPTTLPQTTVPKGQQVFLELLNRNARVVSTSKGDTPFEPPPEASAASGNGKLGIAAT